VLKKKSGARPQTPETKIERAVSPEKALGEGYYEGRTSWAQVGEGKKNLWNQNARLEEPRSRNGRTERGGRWTKQRRRKKPAWINVTGKKEYTDRTDIPESFHRRVEKGSKTKGGEKKMTGASATFQKNGINRTISNGDRRNSAENLLLARKIK